ncbi:TB2/DP1, HVA22 family-domain-containing protein [Schizophyllum fasciatum]
MLMSLLSHLLCAWFAFLLPCFRTWRALAHRPLSEQDVAQYAQYWVVMGAFMTFEYTLETFISWIPFYWELKTLFLLFLSLPQLSGSTWVYNTYISPYFTKNEADIDKSIAAVQSNTVAFLTDKLSGLWGMVQGGVSKANAQAAAQQGQAQPPTAAASPVQTAMNLWNSYGPAVTGYLNKNRAAPPPAPMGINPAAASSTTSFQSQASSAQPRTPYGENNYSNPNEFGAAPPFPQPSI